MAVSYTKLWKLLIDKNMSKTQLIKAAKISTNAMVNLAKMRMFVLKFSKICSELNCSMDDIMEIIPDKADSAS
jgi:DNA (cytosine-5)-methyltransferase 1